jgi:energy coupling factor transporter S component ThiW
MVITRTRKITLAIVLTAVAIALSPIYFPIGPTKCYPWQHMVNGIAGVLLGPWYAAAMAVAAGVVRNMLGVGTLFAFPGGIPGALVVGLTYQYLIKQDYAALTEPIGTGLIGAAISALILGPMIGVTMALDAFIIAFSASSIPGSVVGFFVIIALRRSGLPF